jgi:hypothetical protein
MAGSGGVEEKCGRCTGPKGAERGNSARKYVRQAVKTFKNVLFAHLDSFVSHLNKLLIYTHRSCVDPNRKLTPVKRYNDPTRPEEGLIHYKKVNDAITCTGMRFGKESPKILEATECRLRASN